MMFNPVPVDTHYKETALDVCDTVRYSTLDRLWA